MKKKEIVQKLKNNKEYYEGIGKNYLSNSDIQYLLKEPRQFHVPQPDNENFAKGRLFHSLLLEPEKVKDIPFYEGKTRRGKEWDSFLDKHNLTFGLKTSDLVEMKEMTQHFKSNLKFCDLIYDPSAKYEVPAIGEIDGTMWKGKADVLTDKYVIDIKTSSDVFRFRHTAISYYYHTQAYIYQHLFNKPVIFLVSGKKKKIDKNKKEYYDLGLFDVSEETMARAKHDVANAITVYNHFYAPESTEKIDTYIMNMSI